MESSQNENVILNIDGENKICVDECNIQNVNLMIVFKWNKAQQK
jgi:hypothetical protein